MKFVIISLLLLLSGCHSSSSNSCERVKTYSVWKLDGTVIASKCLKGALNFCGATLDECEDGFEYDCLKDIRVKVEYKNTCKENL